MFITFVRWRLSVGIKRFTLLTYLLPLYWYAALLSIISARERQWKTYNVTQSVVQLANLECY